MLSRWLQAVAETACHFPRGIFAGAEGAFFDPALPCVREETAMTANLDLSLCEIAHATMRASAPTSERTAPKSQVVSIQTSQREISTH